MTSQRYCGLLWTIRVSCAWPMTLLLCPVLDLWPCCCVWPCCCLYTWPMTLLLCPVHDLWPCCCLCTWPMTLLCHEHDLWPCSFVMYMTYDLVVVSVHDLWPCWCVLYMTYDLVVVSDHDLWPCRCLYRGILLARQQRLDEAITSYQNAIKFRPKLSGYLSYIICFPYLLINSLFLVFFHHLDCQQLRLEFH